MLMNEMIERNKTSRSLRNNLAAVLVVLTCVHGDKAFSQSAEMLADAQICVEEKRTNPDLALQRCDNVLKNADQFSVDQRGYLLLVRK